MKLLLLGGTQFLGRHLVEAAIARGHQVTLFNRGQTNPDLFPELEQLRGDRDGHLDALQGRTWDAVIDTSGYVPRVVKATADLLKNAAAHYTFISSISVYSDFSRLGLQEDAPVLMLPDPSTEDVARYYGELKAACEQELDQSWPEQVLHIRPGLLVGPFDPTGRFTYWVERMSAGGEVLVPDVRLPCSGEAQPLQPLIQILDARDLADWMLHLIERQQTGVYNATAPQHPLSLADLFETCRLATGAGARLNWVAPEFLIANGVAPWTDLPLWLNAEMPGFFAVNSQNAFNEGLTVRPLTETIQDTLTWAVSARLSTRQSAHHGATFGLERSREQDLLAQWHRANGSHEN